MEKIIKNYRSIATTKLRQDALDIFEQGMAAIKTEAALRRNFAVNGTNLKVGSRVYNLKNFEKIFVVGCGKASFEAARVLEKMLGKRITTGAVIDVKQGKLRHIKSFAGTHPFPSAKNLQATGQIVAILKNAGPKDLVIVIVSGGGSSLLYWPHTVGLKNFICTAKNLMMSGVAIKEMNIVRKHLSAIQGGQLVQLVKKSSLIGLIFSDVPGDDIATVASGPTVFDETTVKDAMRILSKYDIPGKCNISKGDLSETPRNRDVFRKVQNILVVNNGAAVKAMVLAARNLGFRPRIISTALAGEAREVGELLAKTIKHGEALIAAGETTVKVMGKGKGGRNQEVVLGALNYLKKNALVLSVSSDGRDNSDVAGAFGDGDVLKIADKQKLSAKKYLANNDSFNFFARTNSQIITGITGVNVADFIVFLRKKVITSHPPESLMSSKPHSPQAASRFFIAIKNVPSEASRRSSPLAGVYA
jgi:glycerate-2-kinase